MGKNFKKFRCYVEETWIKLGNRQLSNRTTSRRRTWKIIETPVSDMKHNAEEGSLNKVYAPNGSVTTENSNYRKEMDNDKKEKKEDGVKGWRAELLKFKAEAEEFNVELEKAMARRRQCMTDI
jgi:hypothetical protein